LALEIAATLGCPVAIWSPPAAALDSGVGWFAAIARLARAAHPGAQAVFILDCADRADLVQEAFREGLADACFTGRPAVALRLNDIARKSRARLHRRRPPVFELGHGPGAAVRLRDFLADN
jgi:hypothetical protein